MMSDQEMLMKARALRQELSDLLAADHKHRTRGLYVVSSDQKQHQDRLARVQEIKEELAKMTRPQAPN